MLYHSRWNISIPHQSLPSLLFTSPTQPLSETKRILISASDPSSFLTPSTYRLYSQRLASGIQSHADFPPSSRILVFSPNSLFYPVAFIGIVMAGGIFTGANPSYTARELAYQLNDTEALYLFVSPESLSTGLEAASQVNLPKSRIFIFDDDVSGRAATTLTQGCRHWSCLLASVPAGEKFSWDPCDTPEKSSQTMTLNYSSGTTGLPKGVEISHHNYVANTLQMQHLVGLKKTEEGEDQWLCFLPLYHAYSQSMHAILGPLVGFPVYIMKKFDLVEMLECVQKFKISRLTVVPPILVALANNEQVRKGRWDLSSIKDVGSGAAPMGNELRTELEEVFRGVNVKQGWGMTECTCSAISYDPTTLCTNAAVGELNPNCFAKIMNEAGTAEVAAGERGEIWLKGPNIMKGYWRNEKATKETLTADGWLKTGDICYVDEKGGEGGIMRFFVVDRLKELIKVKGNQVAPAELEALLLDHPAVADAAVIGVTIDHEEYPRAYVVPTPGKGAKAQDIANFVKERVHRSKRLTGGIIFVEAIPKNPSGKILRKVLRERAKGEGSVKARL